MTVLVRASVLLVCAATSGCKVDPLFCDETHRCTDPARPFCDLNGEFPASDGVSRTCIPDPGGDGGTGEQASFSVSVASERLYVRQGESVHVDVAVARDADFDEPIAVTLDGLPAGVVADPVMIATGETTGRLAIIASGDATQGAGDIEVTGTAGDLTRAAPLRLIVAGRPGTLDRSFGTGGRYTLRFGNGNTLGGGLLIQRDDKVVVAGAVTGETPTFQGITIRLNSDGTLDDSFGLGGVASPAVGRAVTHESVLESSEGRILVGGVLVQDGDPHIGLFGYTAAGDLDSTFGSSGTAVMDPVLPGGTSGVMKLFQGVDGALLSVGVTADEAGFDVLHVARHSADGALDEGYRVSEPSLGAETAILDSQGRLVVAGRVTASDQPSFPSFIARFLTDGSPDKSFGTDGRVLADVSTDFENVTGLVELEGRLMAIGQVFRPEGEVLTIARYTGGGLPDLTFGDGGTIVTSVEFEPRARVALLDQEGRLVVAGRTPASLPAVARIVSDGSLDPGFGTAGLATVDVGVPGDGVTQATGAALDADGRIVIAGTVGAGKSRFLLVARLWP